MKTTLPTALAAALSLFLPGLPRAAGAEGGAKAKATSSSTGSKPSKGKAPEAKAGKDPEAKASKGTSPKGAASAADRAELKRAGELLGELSTAKKTSLARLLNSGDRKALMQLPGIGEATADAILKARPLESAAHLILVDGVGEKTFAEIVKSRK